MLLLAPALIRPRLPAAPHRAPRVMPQARVERGYEQGPEGPGRRSLQVS
jgi:hypothetical protein